MKVQYKSSAKLSDVIQEVESWDTWCWISYSFHAFAAAVFGFILFYYFILLFGTTISWFAPD